LSRFLRELTRPGRHPADAAIVALAVPALAALATDPLYSLIDTAFVAHLGTTQLGAVAVGSAAFNASFWIFSFLAYGVTPAVARSVGAGDAGAAAKVGVQALLLALVLGAVVTGVGLLLSRPIVAALGAAGSVTEPAGDYLRIRSLGAVPVLIAQVAHGWLRGAQDTRTPMYVTLAGMTLNLVLDYVFLFLLGFGVAGAAWSNVIGQSAAATAFLLILLPRWKGASCRIDPVVLAALLRVGGHLVVRTGSLLAALTFATAAAARMGLIVLGSWQITMQVFMLLALTLDSVAIAGQALVARQLGAGDRSGADRLARRLMSWGLWVGCTLLLILLAVRVPLAAAFSNDSAVVAATASLLLWLALVQPLAAAAFTLDGILIGASDMAFLARSMALCSLLFMAAAWVALEADWGGAGLAAGTTLWLAARSVWTGARLRSGRWVGEGFSPPAERDRAH
jgi:putative MATE family efflux protein